MIEQDHPSIKRWTRPMLGFKSETGANVTLSGIELMHIMGKQKGLFVVQKKRTIRQQFAALAA